MACGDWLFPLSVSSSFARVQQVGVGLFCSHGICKPQTASDPLAVDNQFTEGLSGPELEPKPASYRACALNSPAARSTGHMAVGTGALPDPHRGV